MLSIWNLRFSRAVTALFLCLLSASAVQSQKEKKSPDAPRSLRSIHSRAEFDSLAVVYDADTPYALPHVLFVIDRLDKNRIYYVDTRRYKFHKDFVNGTYLSLERGQAFFENNYLRPNRRFIMGTIAYQTPVRRWTFEFWEGDLILPDQIKLASDIINKTFFTPVAFKPNSNRQDEASAHIEGLQRVSQTEISKNLEYQPLNVAKGLGRIHVIPKLDEHVEIGFNEILVLDEVPVQLPPVAGIITTKPSTPLSDLSVSRLAGLSEQRAASVIAYGAKSANLGELIHAHPPGFIVPPGFTIPFFYYDRFLKENKLDDAIYQMLNDQKFVHDPAYRRAYLTRTRERFQQGTVNAGLRAEMLRRLHAEFPGKGVFARSSTNSEDLPNFNGAGLYSTVPNVRGDSEFIAAIKSVWASVWNFEAYEARERAGIEHTKIFMAGLIQEGINSESSGVMITADPFNREVNLDNEGT